MANKILTTFNRNNIENNADLGEKIGNIGLGLLRISLGKTVIVEGIPTNTAKTVFTSKIHSTCVRVAAATLFILALPVTAALAGIGYIGTKLSKSHKQLFNSYAQIKLSSIQKDTRSHAIPTVIPDPTSPPAKPQPETKPQTTALPIADLWEHLNKKTKIQLRGVKFLKGNEVPHRFFDIPCPKETAITVSGKYLHANKVGEGIVQRSFVASQAPLSETQQDQGQNDTDTFWKAIFEKTPTIIDLTTEKDQLENEVKKYYPDTLNTTLIFPSVSVTLIEIIGCTHTYQIQNHATTAVQHIKRFHYTAWKDFGTVALPQLQQLVEDVEGLSPNPENLLWIHCRAGVGRTGTLITALALKEKITRHEINKENLDTSLIDIIEKFRKQRGPKFVQQVQQLDLLRQYAKQLLTKDS